jgi:hypothetical protein
MIETGKVSNADQVGVETAAPGKTAGRVQEITGDHLVLHPIRAGAIRVSKEAEATVIAETLLMAEDAAGKPAID